jgi:hypothetical protein
MKSLRWSAGGHLECGGLPVGNPISRQRIDEVLMIREYRYLFGPVVIEMSFKS